MKKQNVKKLVLARETVRNLNPAVLSNVFGGLLDSDPPSDSDSHAGPAPDPGHPVTSPPATG
jgi:hypothetical protein